MCENGVCRPGCEGKILHVPNAPSLIGTGGAKTTPEILVDLAGKPRGKQPTIGALETVGKCAPP